MTEKTHLKGVQKVIALENLATMGELKAKTREGASAILELKLNEIENSINKKDKEIHKLTIPYLNLLKDLNKYLFPTKMKELDSRYETLISGYWGQKK